MCISAVSCFKAADLAFDYLPYLSTGNAILTLFLKCVCKCLPRETVANNRVWRHIEEKSIWRCIVLLVPFIGNIAVMFYDFASGNFDRLLADIAQNSRQGGLGVMHEESPEERQSRLESGSRLAASLARSLGLNVSEEDMAPAATEDEQQLALLCYLGTDIEGVRTLLEKDVDPNFFSMGNRPLTLACVHGTPEMVSLLLEYNADPNAVDHFGITPLLGATQNKNHRLAIIKLLLENENRADVDGTGARGATALMVVCSAVFDDEIDQATVDYLIQQGADPLKKAPSSEDALMSTLTLHDAPNIIPLLITDDENLDERNYTLVVTQLLGIVISSIPGVSPLQYAAIHKRIESMKVLIERSDVRYANPLGQTALHFAAGNPEAVQLLLDQCSDSDFVNHQSDGGRTALHQAIISGSPEAALLLLRYRADPYIVEEPREAFITALKQVPNADKLPLLSKIVNVEEEPILEEGANAAPQTISEEPALYELIADFTVEAPEQPGKTALELAREKGYQEVIQFIEQRENEHHIDFEAVD